MPKEIRNPKSEGERIFDGDRLQYSRFWAWGVRRDDGLLVMREGSPMRGQPADLMERVARFGEAIIRFAKRIPHTPENIRLIGQLVGAGTSVGANFCEADDSVSGKDFRNKIGTCRKESKEAMFFLRMVAASEPGLADEARKLWQEAKELNLIFGSIWRK